jgi:hypothetical protein
MKTKRVLCPERLRHVPHRFSWIDQRLVRDGHIARCGSQALALYLLLVTVADAQGLSYYSDKTAARLLSLNEAQLREARRSLLAAGLIVYESPLYQVLSLETTSTSEPRRDLLRDLLSDPALLQGAWFKLCPDRS